MSSYQPRRNLKEKKKNNLKQTHWSLVQKSSIKVKRNFSPQETINKYKNKTNLFFPPSFINVVRCLEVFQVSQRVQTRQTKLGTPEHIMLKSGSDTSYWHDRSLRKRLSWNVNTAKEIYILQFWGHCHASICFSLLCFIFIYSCDLKGLLFVLVPFCTSLCSLCLWVTHEWTHNSLSFGSVEFHNIPSLIRLHGCCSWCSFVWLKSLKKKNVRAELNMKSMF